MTIHRHSLTCIDLDAGPGTRALGLESAGFTIIAVSTDQPHDVTTIATNRPAWANINPWTGDAVKHLPALGITGTSLLSARLAGPNSDGNPGIHDPIATAAAILNPEAILLEGVPAHLASQHPNFAAPRAQMTKYLDALGYELTWQMLDGADYATPTSYRRAVALATRSGRTSTLNWPQRCAPVTIGETLRPTWDARGLADHADTMTARADRPGPQIVIGPPCAHAPHLGPARAARAWIDAGLDYSGIDPDGTPATINGPAGRGPRLTPAQLAALKGIPDSWELDPHHSHRLYQAVRAFPPPFAAALGHAIASVLGDVQ
jgi:DNA (cytosine-5)-methyltransferase 1